MKLNELKKAEADFTLNRGPASWSVEDEDGNVVANLRNDTPALSIFIRGCVETGRTVFIPSLGVVIGEVQP